MRLILIFLLGCLLSTTSLAAQLPDETQLKQDLQQAETNQTSPAQADIVKELQSALRLLDERRDTRQRADQYQRAIDDFPKLTRDLRQQLDAENAKPAAPPKATSVNDLEQQIVQLSSQLLEQSRQLQQEQDHQREISDSLAQLPQQQTEANRALSEVERRVQALGNPTTALGQAQMA
ncbi:miniconductance mechanosensitive channel MscM, partial [Dickeya dianthicola]|nr:miniconductance mechanosensitive channel MscM [Dickeya dianthicola]